MKRKKKTRVRPDSIKRISFPEAEKEKPWLAALLDAYHIVEAGVAKAVDTEAGKGRRLACAKGCSACCITHKDIPVYPLELLGISWFAAERLPAEERASVKQSLLSYRNGNPCPFLIKGICSIHLMRPMACRQFNVFDTPCSEGEDPYYSRPEDVMPPVKKHVDQAFFIMLPFHGLQDEADRIRLIDSGEVHRMARELHACDWRVVAEKMDRETGE